MLNLITINSCSPKGVARRTKHHALEMWRAGGSEFVSSGRDGRQGVPARLQPGHNPARGQVRRGAGQALVREVSTGMGLVSSIYYILNYTQV